MVNFERSGFASISDIEEQKFKEIYLNLEKEQDTFITEECHFRSNTYKWPKDALHNWSRIWEYPYVYYHLQKLLKNRNWVKDSLPSILDLGSGVTFFPFAVEKLGYKVICIDNDPICVNDLNMAIHHFKKSEAISSKLSDGILIPVPENSIDVLYCISVLEHIENIAPTINEVARVLKPDGVFILTIDIDTRGDSEIGREKYSILRHHLFENFCYLLPNISIHPSDILSTMNSSLPLPGLKNKTSEMFFSSKQIIKSFLGLKTNFPPPVRLNVEAFILRKI